MEYHRAQIREHLTFHAATVQDTTALSEWLCTDQLSQDHRIERLEEARPPSVAGAISNHPPQSA